MLWWRCPVAPFWHPLFIQLQVRHCHLAKLGAAAEDEGLVAAKEAWGSGPRGSGSVPMGSARSVAAGSSVLAVAPEPQNGQLSWGEVYSAGSLDNVAGGCAAEAALLAS